MKRGGRRKIVLIPLDLDGYVLSRSCKSAKAQQIRSRLVADFTRWEDDSVRFEKEANKLLTALVSTKRKGV